MIDVSFDIWSFFYLMDTLNLLYFSLCTLIGAKFGSEIWLFGVNGLNTDYLDAIRATIPLEQ
jgi:hypothetical protein